MLPPNGLLVHSITLAIWATLSQADSGQRLSRNVDSAISLELPTCATTQIDITSTLASMNGSSPPYVLTTFPIGMKPVTTLIGRGVDDLNLVVTYAVGTQLVLAISDLDGSTGRTLPYIFNVVAGYITQCVIPPQVHSTFSFTSNASEETSTAGPWEFRISGGVPPYQLVVTSISSSGSTSVTIFFPDKTYAYFGKGPGSGIVVVSMRDSTGEWASGTSLLRLSAPNGDESQQSSPRDMYTLESRYDEATNTETISRNYGVSDLDRASTATLHHTMSTLPEEQQNLNLRDLDDNSTSTGMIIIIVDVVAVAVFIISVFIVVFRMVSRRGKRPAYHPILPVQHTFVEATNMETLQNHTVEQVVSANDEGTLSKQKPSLETTQLPPPEQGPPSVTSLAPPTPPPSPTIPNPHSPTTPSEVHLPSHFALPSPETYGDPYPSSTRDIFRRSGGARSSATSTSRRPSISSFVTNKTAKAISKLARFSESTYPDEPALSDSWSNVLGRETSRASSATIRSSNKSKHRSSQTQAGSVKGRYWESDDVPEVPPLVFKGGDLQLNFSRGIL